MSATATAVKPTSNPAEDPSPTSMPPKEIVESATTERARLKWEANRDPSQKLDPEKGNAIKRPTRNAVFQAKMETRRAKELAGAKARLDPSSHESQDRARWQKDLPTIKSLKVQKIVQDKLQKNKQQHDNDLALVAKSMGLQG